MKASGPRTSIQVTDPHTGTHILRFTIARTGDDTLRLLLKALIPHECLIQTPTLLAAAAQIGVEIPESRFCGIRK